MRLLIGLLSVLISPPFFCAVGASGCLVNFWMILETVVVCVIFNPMLGGPRPYWAVLISCGGHGNPRVFCAADVEGTVRAVVVGEFFGVCAGERERERGGVRAGSAAACRVECEREGEERERGVRGLPCRAVLSCWDGGAAGLPRGLLLQSDEEDYDVPV